MTEEPLHVQVARALGWTNIRSEEYDQSGDCGMPATGGAFPSPVRPQFRTRWYGRDYGAWPEQDEQEITGIMPWLWAEILERERYNLTVVMTNQYKNRCVDVQAGRIPTWFAQEGDGLWALGDSPGEAVCKLLVRLHAEKTK